MIDNLTQVNLTQIAMYLRRIGLTKEAATLLMIRAIEIAYSKDRDLRSVEV